MTELSNMPPAGEAQAGDFRARLDELSSAEDLFAFFDVAYEERVLHVARLHIMKRLNAYVAEAEPQPTSDDELHDLYRRSLERAYADFVTSTPREQRVFAALERRAEANRGFVGLDELRPPTG